MDDRPGLRIGIVDRNLIVGQAMLEDFVLDTREGKRAGRVEAERFEVPRDQFHCRNASIANVGNKGLAIGEGCLGAPKTKARRIGEVVDVGCTGGRSVKHPRAR